jgi:transcriptional regulator with XRE-family HTH domain
MEYTEGLKIAFGKTLAQFRAKVGISQETLAYSVGINRTYVYLIERGSRNPSLEAIFKFAGGLGVNPEELVAETRKYLEKLDAERDEPDQS